MNILKLLCQELSNIVVIMSPVPTIGQSTSSSLPLYSSYVSMGDSVSESSDDQRPVINPTVVSLLDRLKSPTLSELPTKRKARKKTSYSSSALTDPKGVILF